MTTASRTFQLRVTTLTPVPWLLFANQDPSAKSFVWSLDANARLELQPADIQIRSTGRWADVTLDADPSAHVTEIRPLANPLLDDGALADALRGTAYRITTTEELQRTLCQRLPQALEDAGWQDTIRASHGAVSANHDDNGRLATLEVLATPFTTQPSKTPRRRPRKGSDVRVWIGG